MAPIYRKLRLFIHKLWIASRIVYHNKKVTLPSDDGPDISQRMEGDTPVYKHKIQGAYVFEEPNDMECDIFYLQILAGHDEKGHDINYCLAITTKKYIETWLQKDGYFHSSGVSVLVVDKLDSTSVWDVLDRLNNDYFLEQYATRTP